MRVVLVGSFLVAACGGNAKSTLPSTATGCNDVSIDLPTAVDRRNPHAVAAAFAYWCRNGDQDAIDEKLPQLQNESVDFSTFLRSVCEEFANPPHNPSMSREEMAFLTNAAWLRPAGTDRQDTYTVWYYTILGPNHKPTASTSWLSLHCAGDCAPTGIFWPTDGKDYPMPTNLQACSQ